MVDPLIPADGDTGRAGSHLDHLLHDTLVVWDIATQTLLDHTDSIDLDQASARKDRTIRDVLVTIGEWTDGYGFSERLAAARSHDTEAPPRRLIDAEIRQRHADAGIDEIAISWTAAREAIAQWSEQPGMTEDAAALVGGPLGIVPFGTLIGAGSVAVDRALRDARLVPAASTDSDSLARITIHSLIDAAGAVCAHGDGDYRLVIETDIVTVGMGVHDGSWRTAILPPGILNDEASDFEAPAISARPDVILDIAAGRRSPVTALTRREIEVRDVSGLVTVARGLANAPELPGGEGLRAALAAVDGLSGGIGSAARRMKSALPGLFTRPGSD